MTIIPIAVLVAALRVGGPGVPAADRDCTLVVDRLHLDGSADLRDWAAFQNSFDARLCT